jgi:hypothetical protein
MATLRTMRAENRLANDHATHGFPLRREVLQKDEEYARPRGTSAVANKPYRKVGKTP